MTKPWRRAVVAVAIVAVASASWLYLQFNPLGGVGREELVNIPSGSSLSEIASDLESAHIISSAFAFRIDLALFGSLQVQSGYYQIPAGDSFSNIRTILSQGPNTVDINVTPGLALWEVEQDLNQAEGQTYAVTFMTLANDAAAASPWRPNHSLEGLIAPGNYIVAPGETPAMLLAAMQNGFTAEMSAAGLNPQTRRYGLSAYQILIAASIVEKEGYYEVNKPKVARVILNRLAINNGLQMDSTVLYALHRDGGTVTRAMLENPSPYNTYLHAGLTPTPICTVSVQDIEAVLHAPPGAWRYFTLINKDGTMAFSNTFAQQLANEALAARRGI